MLLDKSRPFLAHRVTKQSETMEILEVVAPRQRKNFNAISAGIRSV